MKPLVIYHANCTDGFGAAFAAWLKFGDDAEYVPMDYLSSSISPSDAWEQLSRAIPSKMNTDREVYILDFSLPKPVMGKLMEVSRKVVWLDHHASVMREWGEGTWPVPPTAHVVLDNNKSGALLAWEYFHPEKDVPYLISRIDDRDRWQFKFDDSKALHAGLNAQPFTFESWKLLTPLGTTAWASNYNDAVSRGRTI